VGISINSCSGGLDLNGLLSVTVSLMLRLFPLTSPLEPTRTIRSTAQPAPGQTDALSDRKWFHVFNQRFHLNSQLLN
jgi:hypothetical protein